MPVDLPRTLALKILRVYWRIFKPITLGVKGILIDNQNRVLLVRHTYQPGWHFPGGGVNRNEDIIAAIEREIREEVGLEVTERPVQAFGIFTNFSEFKSDHVVVFLFKSWRVLENVKRSPEIAEWSFFPLDALPKGTTPATLRRLDEIAGKVRKGYLW